MVTTVPKWNPKKLKKLKLLVQTQDETLKEKERETK